MWGTRPLKVVAQRELHYARLGVKGRIVAKSARRQRDSEEERVDIKSSGVRHVENLPGKLYALAFGDLKHLGQTGVEIEVAISAGI